MVKIPHSAFASYQRFQSTPLNLISLLALSARNVLKRKEINQGIVTFDTIYIPKTQLHLLPKNCLYNFVKDDLIPLFGYYQKEGPSDHKFYQLESLDIGSRLAVKIPFTTSYDPKIGLIGKSFLNVANVNLKGILEINGFNCEFKKLQCNNCHPNYFEYSHLQVDEIRMKILAETDLFEDHIHKHFSWTSYKTSLEGFCPMVPHIDSATLVIKSKDLNESNYIREMVHTILLQPTQYASMEQLNRKYSILVDGKSTTIDDLYENYKELFIYACFIELLGPTILPPPKSNIFDEDDLTKDYRTKSLESGTFIPLAEKKAFWAVYSKLSLQFPFMEDFQTKIVPGEPWSINGKTVTVPAFDLEEVTEIIKTRNPNLYLTRLFSMKSIAFLLFFFSCIANDSWFLMIDSKML